MRVVIVSCFCGAGTKLVEQDGRTKETECHVLTPCEKHKDSPAYQVMAQLLSPSLEYTYGG